jgi:acetolactate synthase-1/2/3 large subunit
VSAADRRGDEIVSATLEALGVRTLFGVPGTQTVGLFEALRRSSIRTVLATHELGAAFMANGYFRASGEVGVLVTIPGPGFAYALAGLAEARADSAGLLHVTGRPNPTPNRRFLLQHLDQASVAGPLVKSVFDVERTDCIRAALSDAHALALAGEPGPVLVQISGEALTGTAQATEHEPLALLRPTPVDAALFEQVAARLAAARRPVIFAGQGALGVAPELRQLVERCSIPVLTTPSGRGVIPEEHPLALCFEPHRGDVAAVNALLDAADLVLAVGCKLAHNGTVGFALRLPPDRLVHVNTDPEALGANYPASLEITASVEALLEHLLRAPGLRRRAASTWDAAEVAQWRDRLQAEGADRLPEPSLRSVPGGKAASFFSCLRRALPRDGILVTDSGLHQVLARRHFAVFEPRGLIMPSDFQSMGFGVPAAIGAKLGAPSRPVVAVVGDGGFLMSGMELVTAVREAVPVTVVVFNDGQLNQIRLQQFREVGHPHAVALGTPDLEAFAGALALDYVRLTGDPETVLRAAIASRRPTLVEVEVGDSPAIRRLRASGLARGAARGLLPGAVLAWLKRLLGQVGPPAASGP